MKGNIKRARFYTRKVHKDGMTPFVTDDSLDRKVEEEFYELEDRL